MYTVTRSQGKKVYSATSKATNIKDARKFYLSALRNIAMYQKGNGVSVMRLLKDGQVLSSHTIQLGVINALSL